MTESLSDAAIPEDYPDREQWLAARRSGIGASEAAAVLGVSPWKTPLQLYAEKLEITEPDIAETEAMQWGLLLEAPVAEHYATVTGRTLADPGRFTLHRSRMHPWMVATLDRAILRAEGRTVPGVLEIKTTGGFRAEDWETEPPMPAQVQAQHQLAVMDWQWGSIAVLIGGQRFRYFDVERNDAFIEAMIATEAAFWQRLEEQNPPPVDGSDSARDLLKRLYPKETPGLTVVLPGEATDWAARRLEGIALGKQGEAMRTAAENRIKQAIGEAEVGVLSDGSQFTWRATERAGYVVQATLVRTLRFKEAK